MPVWLQILVWLFSCGCTLAWLAPALYVAREFQRRTDESYRAMIIKWAGDHGWEVVRCRRRKLGSPWTFSNTGAQGIYQVVILLDEGQPRHRQAWVRCGGWFFGPKTARVETFWDGPSKPAPPPEPEPPPPRIQDDPMWDRSLDG